MLDWKSRMRAIPFIGKVAEYTYWLLRLPIVPKQVQRLCETNTSCFGLIADLLPRLQQDVQRSSDQTASLTQKALPEMLVAARESKEEVQRLKHRYAEFYGAILEQLMQQNEQLEKLAEQQVRILHLIDPLSGPSTVKMMTSATAQLPKAG